MANTHGYINTTHCACWNVDAYNLTGVATTNLDNGVFVTLDNMAADSTTGKINGYEYDVSPADGTSTSVWVIDTPEVGSTLEMQLMSDPRYFYNIAGKPMTLRYLVPKVDCIEVDANCFVGGVMPNKQVIVIGADGKLAGSDTIPTGGAVYFRPEGLHEVDIGMEKIETVILRIQAN